MPARTAVACVLGLLACSADAQPGSRLEPMGAVSGAFTITEGAAWFSSGDGAIRHLELATGAVEMFGTIDPAATDLSVIDDRAYWTYSDHLERCGRLYVTTPDRVERTGPEDGLCWSLIGSFERRLIVRQRASPSSIGETIIATYDVETQELAIVHRFFSSERVRLVDHQLVIVESGVARIVDLRTGRTVQIPIKRTAPFWMVPTGDDGLVWLENDVLIEQHEKGGPFEIATVSPSTIELGRAGSVWTALEETDDTTDLLRIDGAGRAHRWPVSGAVDASLVHDDAYWFTTVDETSGSTLWRFGP